MLTADRTVVTLSRGSLELLLKTAKVVPADNQIE